MTGEEEPTSVRNTGHRAGWKVVSKKGIHFQIRQRSGRDFQIYLCKHPNPSVRVYWVGVAASERVAPASESDRLSSRPHHTRARSLLLIERQIPLHPNKRTQRLSSGPRHAKVAHTTHVHACMQEQASSGQPSTEQVEDRRLIRIRYTRSTPTSKNLGPHLRHHRIAVDL